MPDVNQTESLRIQDSGGVALSSALKLRDQGSYLYLDTIRISDDAHAEVTALAELSVSKTETFHVTEQATATRGGELAVELTESVRLRDQGAYLYLGQLHLQDQPPSPSITGGPRSVWIVESARIFDGYDSYAELTEDERIRSSETVNAERITSGVAATSQTETLKLRDSGGAALIGALKVSDSAQGTVGVGANLTANPSETVKLRDAYESFAQLGSPETIRVTDVLLPPWISEPGSLIISGEEHLKVTDTASVLLKPLVVSLTEAIKTSDTANAQRISNYLEAAISEQLRLWDGATGQTSGFEEPVTGPPPLVLTIAGQSMTYRRGTLYIQETINGRSRLSVNIQSLDASWRPTLYSELIVEDLGVRLFGGLLNNNLEESVGGEATVAIEHAISAMDFNGLAERRYITISLLAGTLRSQLLAIVPYLAAYGVTLHAGQVDGPAMPAIVYEDVRIDEILNDLTRVSDGYLWSIDYHKVLRAALPGANVAPFNINDDSLGDITVESNREDDANYIILFYGNGTAATSQDFISNGVSMSYQTTYRSTKDINDVWPNVLYFNGVVQRPVGWGPTQLPGAQWYWDYDTHTLVNNTGVPAPFGVVITVPYTIQYPIKAIASSGAAPADLVEKVYERPDIFSAIVAQAQADALLAQRAQTQRIARYRDTRSGLAPGQSQTIVSSKRAISGTWLITDLVTHDAEETRLVREVTASEGTQYLGSWRDSYAGGGGSGVGSTGGGPGGVITVPAVTKTSYFLGGSGIEAVQSPTPTWVPASGGNPTMGKGAIQVRINTATRGSTLATVTVRLRLASIASVSVKARLYDVTSGVACPGESAVVASTEWTTAVFSTTLTAGEKDYELQVLPGTAGQDVFATGYLE